MPCPSHLDIRRHPVGSNLIKNIKRFLEQPRLRLAWILTLVGIKVVLVGLQFALIDLDSTLVGIKVVPVGLLRALVGLFRDPVLVGLSKGSWNVLELICSDGSVKDSFGFALLCSVKPVKILNRLSRGLGLDQ